MKNRVSLSVNWLRTSLGGCLTDVSVDDVYLVYGIYDTMSQESGSVQQERRSVPVVMLCTLYFITSVTG